MTAYITAKTNGLDADNQTKDAENVAKLKALSSSDIDANKVRQWLTDKGLLTYDGTAWFGTLEEATLSTDLQNGVRDLKARVLSGQPIRTAQIEFAPKVLSIITGIAAAVPGLSGLVDSFYALDGGRPWKDLTVQQFAAQRTAAQAQESKMALRLRIDTAWNQIGTPEQATAANTFEAIAAELRG